MAELPKLRLSSTWIWYGFELVAELQSKKGASSSMLTVDGRFQAWGSRRLITRSRSASFSVSKNLTPYLNAHLTPQTMIGAALAQPTDQAHRISPLLQQHLDSAQR